MNVAAVASDTSSWSDAALVGHVARAVAVPREAAANSFVLHAPLELTARAGLLSLVSPSTRAQARQRIAEMVPNYEQHEPALPVVDHEFVSLASAAQDLADAIGASDLERTDVAASFLGRRARPEQLTELLGAVVLPSLAAAAHGSIFLYLLPRIAPRGDDLVAMVRPLARELARNSFMRIVWLDTRPTLAGNATADDLLAAVLATPRLGVPGSDFIYPIMHQAEADGMAARLLGGPTATTNVAGAARALLRVAAWSMLQEPPDHAPYGWSHCLTMTQGALGVAPRCADPSLAVAVAATYVVGFRAALGQRDLAAEYAPEPVAGDPRAALEGTPVEAAAALWHASAGDRAGLVQAVIDYAAAHTDAHLVKYTLACLDAAAFDREQSRLYLAAMASLGAWWRTFDV